VHYLHRCRRRHRGHREWSSRDLSGRRAGCCHIRTRQEGDGRITRVSGIKWRTDSRCAARRCRARWPFILGSSSGASLFRLFRARVAVSTSDGHLGAIKALNLMRPALCSVLNAESGGGTSPSAPRCRRGVLGIPHRLGCATLCLDSVPLRRSFASRLSYGLAVVRVAGGRVARLLGLFRITGAWVLPAGGGSGAFFFRRHGFAAAFGGVSRATFRLEPSSSVRLARVGVHPALPIPRVRFQVCVCVGARTQRSIIDLSCRA